MSILAKRIKFIAKKPKFKSIEYKKWIGQEDFVQFLRDLPKFDEIILYASTKFEFIYCVLVPTKLIKTIDKDDLFNWGCNPFSGWGITISGGKKQKIFLSDPLDHTGSKIIDQGEQIIFARKFEGRLEQKSYFEISSRLTHPFDLHYVPERDAYCQFNDQGDVVEIIQIENILSEDNENEGRLVSIKRHVLDEYLSLTHQSIILLFDSTRFEPNNFNSWRNEKVEHFEDDPMIYYRIGRNDDLASYLRGFQIIQSRLTMKELIKIHGYGQIDKKQYASFLALDWKHGEIKECSCDPKNLGNYFVPTDLPYEISPVFFRPEVLLKYKSNSDKYEITDRSINCRNGWFLQTYDVNADGQVHTYLKYLSYLPFSEQLYWKSFNELPKGPISKRALKTDFEGQWDLDYDALRSLREIIVKLTKSKISWWKLRDDSLVEKVHYPVTDSSDEWAKEIHTLDKLLIEGFEVKVLRSMAKSLGRGIEQEWKSLKLIQEILYGLSKTEGEVKKTIEPLSELHNLRSKISGHAHGSEAEKIKIGILKKFNSFPEHFRILCKYCDNSTRLLYDYLQSYHFK